MEFDEAYRLTEPKEPRLKVSLIDEEINVEYITGDMQFYDNDICNARFQSNFTGFLAIGDAIANGTDGSHDTMKVMKSIGTVTYSQPDDKKDLNGRLFAQIEAMLIQSFQFDGFFEPSLGTIWRLKRILKPILEAPTPLEMYFIRPRDYYLDLKCRIEFQHKLAEFRHVAKRAGFEPTTHRVYAETIPMDKLLCFCSSGWKMHDFPQCNGIGIEFNPHVAVITGAGLLDVAEYADFYDVKYVKNNWTHDIQYNKFPRYYRYHASDFLNMHGHTSRFEHNLFNVVSTRLRRTYDSVKCVPITAPAHCAMRVIVPTVYGDIYDNYEGIQIKLATDVNGNVVDVINPQLELSSRTTLLALMGYFRPVYQQGNFSVLSSIRSVYSNFARTGVSDTSRRFTFCSVDFPSSWFYNGEYWYLRAYPDAARFRTCNDNTKIYFDNLGNSIVPDVNGRWFYPFNDYWVLVPVSEYYDDKLICREHKNLNRNYYVNGLVTKVYREIGCSNDRLGDKEESFVVTDKVCNHKMVDSVTLQITKKIGVTREVFDTGLVTKSVKYRNNDKIYRTYYFETVAAATQFFNANKPLFRFICYGDLFKPKSFIDPTCRQYVLIPKEVYCVDDFYYTYELSLTNMFKVFRNYDPAGNFFGADLYGDKYSLIDVDEFD